MGYAPFGLRVVTGWRLFRGGVTELLPDHDPDPSNDWTAAGALGSALADNPFAGAWASIAGRPAVDWPNVLGLTPTGPALSAGVIVRFSAFWGVLSMPLR